MSDFSFFFFPLSFSHTHRERYMRGCFNLLVFPLSLLSFLLLFFLPPILPQVSFFAPSFSFLFFYSHLKRFSSHVSLFFRLYFFDVFFLKGLGKNKKERGKEEERLYLGKERERELFDSVFLLSSCLVFAQSF